MAAGANLPGLLLAAAGVVLVGVVRAQLDAVGARICHRHARLALSRLRGRGGSRRGVALAA